MVGGSGWSRAVDSGMRGHAPLHTPIVAPSPASHPLMDGCSLDDIYPGDRSASQVSAFRLLALL